MNFGTLSGRNQLTQLCEKTYFQYRATAGKKYKTRPDGDDGWETSTPLSRSFPESQVVAAIPGGRTIGPVREVRIAKILGECGLEISSPSIVTPANTSYVVISRETERFVNEIQDHKGELRSSSDLLTAFQKSERRDLCGEEKGSNSIQETCAPEDNKETCVNPLSNSIIDSGKPSHLQSSPMTQEMTFTE